eukprot:GEMP01071362.1.p2 GENE.GEMP01071362.1~~GEMP01071362.1.p2  ORF type:complete len:107 (+),score=17.43 GEMP01071362.1:747-1067(+)
MNTRQAKISTTTERTGATTRKTPHVALPPRAANKHYQPGLREAARESPSEVSFRGLRLEGVDEESRALFGTMQNEVDEIWEHMEVVRNRVTRVDGVLSMKKYSTGV